jgi:MFS family permease
MGGGAVAVVVALTGLSLFYRSCLSVIAPELSRDLGLSPEDLGHANGAFFLSMAAMQIPVGLLFDRYGPRRVVAGFTVLAVVAAALHGMVRTPGELVAVRLLLGVGCAASFMGAG